MNHFDGDVNGQSAEHLILVDEPHQIPLPQNPAWIYLNGLASVESKRSVASHLARFTRYWNIHGKFLALDLAAFDHSHWKQRDFPSEFSRNELTAFAAPWQQLNTSVISAVIELIRRDMVTFDSKPVIDASTHNGYLSAIRGVAKAAFRRGHITESTLDNIIEEHKARKINKEPRGRNVLLEQCQQVIDQCLIEGTLTGLRDATIFALLFGCGPRRAELVSINIKDIDLDECEIKVTGKGDKGRTLYMQVYTRDLIRDWIDESGIKEGALFRRINRWGQLAEYTDEMLSKMERTRPISRPEMQRIIFSGKPESKKETSPRLTTDGLYKIIQQRMLKHSDFIGTTTPHDFRRGFITYLWKKKVDVVTIANLVGHSNINTTLRYIRELEEAAKSAASLVDFGSIGR